MCENEIEITCQNRDCRSINIYKNAKTRNDIEYYACPKCKQITVARTEKGKHSGICNYTGHLSKSPTGVISADGGKTYITANGGQLTREKFIREYGVDPMQPLLERLERTEVSNFIEDWVKKHLI
jgi:hypothetical protein